MYGASSPSADASYSTSSSQAHLQTTTALASINADSLSINANHTNLLASSITGNGNLHTNSLTHSNLANTSSYDTNSTSIGTNGGYFLNNADSSTSSALATISNTINIQSNNNQTNNTLASSLQSLNRDTTKNNNITLKDYTQTAIDKQRENNQVGQLQLQLSQKSTPNNIKGTLTMGRHFCPSSFFLFDCIIILFFTRFTKHSGHPCSAQFITMCKVST